ncbi:MAG: PhnD/SsuA/transferrin family substrate-binding protein [Bryobacteraceae bacterium]
MRASAQPLPEVGSPPTGLSVRLAISEDVLRGVNKSDATAAIQIWAGEIGRATGLRLATDHTYILSSDRLIAGIRNGMIDLFCLTTQEYRRVTSYVDVSHIISDGGGGTELLLVVRSADQISNLAGLRGRKIVVLDDAYSGLAEQWLAVSMRREGLGSPSQVLGSLTKRYKAAQVVLPVFFGQADACVVTRTALETMFELNPQLSRNLKILSASPKMLTAFLAVAKDFPAQQKQVLFDRILSARTQTAARQVLMLFHSSGFRVVEPELLRNACSLLDAHEKHFGTQSALSSTAAR